MYIKGKYIGTRYASAMFDRSSTIHIATLPSLITSFSVATGPLCSMSSTLRITCQGDVHRKVRPSDRGRQEMKGMQVIQSHECMLTEWQAKDEIGSNVGMLATMLAWARDDRPNVPGTIQL